MPPLNLIKITLVVWCLAEALVFALVVHFVGLGWAALAGLLSSIVGFSVLKRSGTAAFSKLRGSFGGRGAGRGFDVVDDGLSVLGAMALLLPGFLSDLVGLALMVRPLRERIAPRLGSWLGGKRAASFPGGRQPPRRAAVVDLDPEEWRRTDQRRAPEIS